MKIYEDHLRQIVTHRLLFENKIYYIDFEQASDEEIFAEIKSSKLTQFIEWQRGNKYGTLAISNFIGNIYFFFNTYDVRSRKFLTELSGSEQFQTILNDIQELSKNIIFTYSSPSFVLRQVDYKDANPTLLLMFNYFKKIILDWNHTVNLQSNVHSIVNNPNFKYASEYKIDRIEKIKKFDSKTIRSLASENKHYVKVDHNRTDIINLPITQFVSQNSSDHYIPTKALMKKKYLSSDTPENRFVKFFLRYIESIAYRLNTIRDLPENVVEEKEQILSFCRTTLNQSFFKNIGQMGMIPVHSTVLQSRSGYKEILSHFTRSRFGIKHIFEDFEQEAMSIDLKRISELYEYWVFYKIAIAFLGEKIIIEQQDVMLRDGDIYYSVCFRNETISVYYNWTESRARKSAYSVTLRPDTTVVARKENTVMKFIFDAKYKVRIKNGADGIERHVKSEDIYKMHTYLDAIENCVFAIAVYPGSEFYFYERELKYPIRSDIESIDSFDGVGAVPLVPENKKLNDQFDNLIGGIKEKFGLI